MSENFMSSEYSANNEAFEPEKDTKTEGLEVVKFDASKNEVIILSVQEGGEKRHPFQTLLYELRNEGVMASTSEWLDLQKVLKSGQVENLDDLYVVSRSLLVKDITGYPKFDTVFGRMFYGIEPPQKEEDEQDQDQDDDRDEDEMEEEPQPEEQDEQPKEEEEQPKEPNESQEIVEPGQTEEHHGGKDVHKEIKDSKSSGHEGGGEPKPEEGKAKEKSKQEGDSSGGGGQKDEKSGGNKNEEGESGGAEKDSPGGGKKDASEEGGGDKNEAGEGGEGKEKKDTGGGNRKEKSKKSNVIKKGKGGYNAREAVFERKYDEFDEDKILSDEQLGRALAKLTTVIQEATEVPIGKLNEKETVASMARNAGIPKLVWRQETEQKPKVILMFDVGGSTDEFRPIMEKLFKAAGDQLDDLEILYFHNAVYGDVWPQKDGNWGKNFIPLDKLLQRDSNSKVIIVGDAWMSEDELHDEFELDPERSGGRSKKVSGYSSFKDLKATFDNVVWINPILENHRYDRDESGTIAALEKVFPMYDLSLRGIEKAVQKLMED